MSKVTKKGKDNTLAIAKPTQQDIPALLATVNEKITALKGGQEKKENTTGTTFPQFGEIKRVDSVEDLIKIQSVLTAKEEAYNKAAKNLNVDIKKYPFKLNGFGSKAWASDIKSRLAVVKNKTELKKMEQVKKLLEENLSQEAKLENDLVKAQKILLDEL